MPRKQVIISAKCFLALISKNKTDDLLNKLPHIVPLVNVYINSDLYRRLFCFQICN